MKALFIGLGSIGQRHIRNLKQIAGKDSLELMAYRQNQNRQLSIIENGQLVPCKSLASYYGFKEFNKLSTALLHNPDVVFICNPSSLHASTALELAKHNCIPFIEKPLATNIQELLELEKIIKERNLISFVGYQSRFNPCVEKTHELIKNQTYGDIVSAHFEWMTYLPDHHKYEDYKKGYAARSDLGGGIIFCLSHELDLINHFFGIPEGVYAIEGGKSSIDIKAEDTISALFLCNFNQKNFPVSLRLSFAQGYENRCFKILFKKATLECNLMKNSLYIIDHKQNIILDKRWDKITRNDLFIREMKHFYQSVLDKKETQIPISEGKKSVLISIALHDSIKLNKIVKI